MYDIVDMDEFVGQMLKLRDEIVSVHNVIETEKFSDRYILEELKYLELHLADIIEKHIVRAEDK